MKTLELNNLPTPVLLVWGLPEDAELIEVRPHQIRNAVHEEDCYAVFSGDTYLFRSPFKIAFIGKLSELTEEQAKGLVESRNYPIYSSGEDGMYPEFIYNEIVYTDYRGDISEYKNSALESFHSAIEAEGQETKTLPANTLIFKRV